MDTSSSHSISDPEAAAEGVAFREALLSSALVSIFRGRFCDALLRGRGSVWFDKDNVLYDMGDKSRTMFFVQDGFVKVGTVTRGGREIIYDIRKDGDVVGELSAWQSPRRDRAVALERTEAIPVLYAEIVGALRENPALLSALVEIFCEHLAAAYEQIDALSSHDLVPRLIQILLGLASKIGRPAGDAVQISAYLTQEEISQMVGARRERVSTALNLLRRRGMLDYSKQGHLLLRVGALQNFIG